ncbi:hypothetical protein SAMN06265377_1078 [Flagellimonas pacifica]|uniref:Uncharacterized protein n=1 Tax=Flagellimonas pacifica TaxID=1247520 RepID=A0A285ME20_9FLAO|nr:hypothetical protein SAMN06265377_1078 [Allomuricauda parva]
MKNPAKKLAGLQVKEQLTNSKLNQILIFMFEYSLN